MLQVHPALIWVAIAGLANVLGGLFPLLRRSWPRRTLHAFVGFSAGFLFSLALLDLIPESLEAGEAYALWILAGFAAVYLVDRLLAGHVHLPEEPEEDGAAAPPPTGVAHITAIAGLLIHTFLDGASVVTAFVVDPDLGWLLFAAIVLHKIPDGFAAASLILEAGGSRIRAAGTGALLGLSTLVGGAAVTFAQASFLDEWTHAILAISAGAFLYVSATDLLPHLNHSGTARVNIAFFVGIGLAVLLHLAFGGASLHVH